jgi:hypothetical protein
LSPSFWLPLAAKNGGMHSQSHFPADAQTLVALLFKSS